ncbi:cohesin domain-containing protein [Oerskovia flava]|uniref:cohesin domain-containing protein n=1 Tax=Oerskovia flava TaxID=2986422 RepID=UPI00223F3A06|nr:cohesin domain-containing protein [Oerskovia sp. JB1-3-2]
MSVSLPRPATLRASVWGLGLAVAATALAASPAAAVPDVDTFTLDVPAAASAGDEFDVTLTASAVSDLYAYEVVLAYDADLLTPDLDGVTLPEGGFDDVTGDEGVVVLTHTRLGSSPGLEGDLTLAALSFTVTDGVTGGSGTSIDTTVDVVSVGLVGADGETLLVEDAAAATITIAAVEQPGEPEPTTDPVDPGPTDPSEPTDDTTSAAPVSSEPSPGASSGGDADGTGGSLASTGAAVGTFVAIALLAVVSGIVLVRRRAVMSR